MQRSVQLPECHKIVVINYEIRSIDLVDNLMFFLWSDPNDSAHSKIFFIVRSTNVIYVSTYELNMFAIFYSHISAYVLRWKWFPNLYDQCSHRPSAIFPCAILPRQHERHPGLQCLQSSVQWTPFCRQLAGWAQREYTGQVGSFSIVTVLSQSK